MDGISTKQSRLFGTVTTWRCEGPVFRNFQFISRFMNPCGRLYVKTFEI